jgi:hypothetical protein
MGGRGEEGKKGDGRTAQVGMPVMVCAISVGVEVKIVRKERTREVLESREDILSKGWKRY